MDGCMDVWMHGPWCHCFVGWIFGFAVLERDFVNRLLFWKQMIERKIIEQIKCRVMRRGVCYGVEPRGIYFGKTMLQGYYLT